MVSPSGIGSDLMTNLDIELSPDPRRVLVRLFVPGEDAPMVRSRAAGLVERVAGLDESEAQTALEETLRRFGHRHLDLEATFQHHYDLIRHRVTGGGELSATRCLLIGAYFSHEYAVEAAALCNPSMVAHPDQSMLDPGQLRVAISLRQIGEGHLSSIGFAEAVIGPDSHLSMDDRSVPVVAGQRTATRHRRDLLVGGMAEASWDDEVSAKLLSLLAAGSTLEHLRQTLAASYSVTFPADVALEQRVLFPSTPTERNGMEDARFVRYADSAGAHTYFATYTAYDGRSIALRMLSSTDLRTFDVNPLRGPAAANKGMAFFPRQVGGRKYALCRSDGETLGLSVQDGDSLWQPPIPLRGPVAGWDLIQSGNCGSPIETDAGWLVLTHGVGPMRRYAMSAILLDLDHPEKVIGHIPGILIAPDGDDQFGYVPNVVYSCGGLLHRGTLWIPYGVGDTRVRFATADVAELLAAMV
jgi:predicted GH43/DUF377 family glycosyl hydrolase